MGVGIHTVQRYSRRMQYRVTLKKLLDGQYYARCTAAPSGIAVTQSTTRENALEKMRSEIRYQLEWCPCSGVSNDYVRLEVMDLPDAPNCR